MENDKNSICFGITRLGIGGAERVLVDLANEFSNYYDITIFTIYGGGELEKELNSKIKLKSLYTKEKKHTSFFVFLFSKKIYNRYIKNSFDKKIAFLEGPITRIFSFGQDIAWVHNDIKKVYGKSIKAKLKLYIDKFYYKKYRKIIFVSKQNKKSFEELYGNISQREVIYNYINKERVIKQAKESINIDMPTLVTVSRLVKQKGIDRFIKVHKRLIDDGIYHKVYVIGDGEEKERLQSLAKKLDVEKTFIFLGKKENPYPYIKSAEYFTLLSYYEGYGMVIEEAKILNKPIIITNTAAREAVQNYNKSLIIENNEEEIYLKLRRVLNGEYIHLQENTKYDNEYLIEDVKELFKAQKLKISILTATYNREKYLSRLYKSILDNSKKSNMEFEWIIIDDGSTDNTKKLINTWNDNRIKYVYQNNLGKMKAINNGMNYVTGNLIVDCDSDDYFTENAFKIIEQNALKLLENEELYALCFLKQDTNKNISRKRV